MDPSTIEKVTKIVLSKLQSIDDSRNEEGVKMWDHTASTPTVERFPSSSIEEGAVGQVKFSKFDTTVKKTNHRANKGNGEATIQQKEPLDGLKELTNKTPARIGVGRAGVRPKTNAWLKFRYDHAAAVDAVFGEVDQSLLEALELFTVKTKVTDKETYIRRPDFGRRLSDEAKEMLNEKCQQSPQIQIIVSDGLSSKAINANLEDVYLSLQQSLKTLGLDVGTSFFIEKGRVAVMDDIGEQLKPEVVILLVGERPGLVSAESLSAYLCYKPRLDTIESDRTVLSNIHQGGIPPVEAGAYLGSLVEKIVSYEASGVSLVKKEG
ncbi:ethanolamine ammonia-lyase subunit EutC [Virgibacillus necropolis]|uniref:Ethanolamine ammonia-lyase small subunit n=1 Tax=Virgibacillus necropolis TaxID=163877 RepID=A0A221M9P3_9BACI|nr:ethanolamine ammonia-lyase subunit EutC [Virgibacillus necropolis]ASN04341.1 ethanolamine ammonia-lyase [Virgibacillus necropolis]